MNLRRSGVKYLEGAAIPASNALKANVESYAERVAKVAKFEVGSGLDDFVKELGGTIHYEEMDQMLNSGSIFVHGEFDFDILLPTYTSPRRDRFTIAHELGHYFLHSAQGETPIIAYRQGSTRIEWEANWFAASLLMPRREFIERCRAGDSDVMIAATFGVSEDAVKVRRKALGV